jgi:hypothetical protein
VYIDPGTLMPLASALAGIVGALLLFWRRVTGAVRTAFSAVRQKVTTLFSA